MSIDCKETSHNDNMVHNHSRVAAPASQVWAERYGIKWVSFSIQVPRSE